MTTINFDTYLYDYEIIYRKIHYSTKIKKKEQKCRSDIPKIPIKYYLGISKFKFINQI